MEVTEQRGFPQVPAGSPRASMPLPRHHNSAWHHFYDLGIAAQKEITAQTVEKSNKKRQSPRTIHSANNPAFAGPLSIQKRTGKAPPRPLCLPALSLTQYLAFSQLNHTTNTLATLGRAIKM
ncbi:hypothetical protein B0H14DRAFT_2637193 [Mycena olivaceomarginata]|nr:hypothetical protein B0H14DRAFT_2637193 [Mycena olivaceomarginata]